MYYESDEEIEDERKWNKVRERNIKINIAKQLIANGRVEEKSFTKQDLKDLFAFKESDILYIAPNIFDISGEQYVMNLTFSEFIDKIIQSNKAVKDALLASVLSASVPSCISVSSAGSVVSVESPSSGSPSLSISPSCGFSALPS